MKKYIKNLVIYVVICSFVIPANSQTTISLNSQVALNEAHTVATYAMLEEYSETERQNFRQNLSVTATNTYSVIDTTFMYEVFFNNGKGILLSGNKNCLPVLGYLGNTEMSVFDTNAPCCLTALLEGYVEQVRASFVDRRGNAENTEKWDNLLAGSINRNRANIVVEPLTKSIWGQSSSNCGTQCEAYNYYVADKNCSNCGTSKKPPAGCGAVAMAQVMYYWKYPVSQGSAEYDWCNMSDELRNSSSNYISERNAVAYLIKDCASAIVTIYGCKGSSSISTQIALALNRRGYTHALQLILPQIWIGRIKNNLDNGRPLIIGLGGNGGGHFVVCDGYRSDDYFHFNWGWNGSYWNINAGMYQDDMWFTMDNIYDNDGTYPNGLKDYIYSIYPSDNFDHCNFNVTLQNTSQDIPKYPTNLTVNFGNTANNTITSGQNVTYFAHQSIIIKPGFKAVAGSKFIARIEPCANCHQPQLAPLRIDLSQDEEYQQDEDENEAGFVNTGIKIFPNPTIGIVNIEVLGNTEIQSISVFDVSGRMLQNNIAFVGNTLNLSYLIDGVYFLKIQTLSGQATHKVIIQK